MRLRWIALLVLLQAGTIPQGPTPEPASIEGTVLRVGTREPVEEARVSLIRNATFDVDPLNPEPLPSASTDAQGRFALRNLKTGSYRLTVSANGYVRQEYGQRVFTGLGVPIQLTPGLVVKDVTVEMTPTGIVTGTIRDVEKQPLAGVPVKLMRESYDARGERRLRPFGNVTRTDDRGEFRIYYITPGRYYVNAGTPPGPPGTGEQTPRINEVQEIYAYAYYPGVTDVKFATPIDVLAGSTRTGVDLTLGRIRGVRVTGRIIDSVTGQPPETPKIRLAYRDPGTAWDYDLEYMGRGKVNYKDGVFEFRDVLPGLFAVSVSIDIPGQAAPQPGVTPLQRIGYVPVEVGNSDVEGIAVIASPGTSIFGRFRVEGVDDWTKAVTATNAKIGVQLEPSSNGVMPLTPGVPSPTYGPINPDGTFRIDNVMPGEFRLSVAWLQQKYYIKQARLGFSDLLSEPFQFTGKEQGTLEIVMSSNAASVNGVVTDNRLGGVSGAQVVLIPEKARHRAELFKTVSSDKNGRFVITNIPPGDYKLYAWDAIEPYRWFDADYVKLDEQFARPVHLSESSSQTVDARLIPVRVQ